MRFSLVTLSLFFLVGTSHADPVPTSLRMRPRADVATAKFRTKDVLIEDTLQVGATAPDPTQKVVFSSAATTTRVMNTITSAGHTEHDSTGGSNQLTHLFISATAGYKTTSFNGTNRAIEITAACSVSSGGGTCEDTAVLANAANGYSWYSTSGAMRQNGAVTLGPGLVTLGDNVAPLNLPGTTGTATQATIGWPAGGTPGNVFSGVSLAVKNAQGGVSVGGVGVALDTTIASGIRGGFFMSRGAGGGLAGGLTAGVVTAGGSGFPFVNSAAGEVNVYSEFGLPIVFGADDAGFTSAFRLTKKNHLVVDDTSGTNTPALNAGCTSGGSSSIVGNDIAFKLITGATSTACTVTFDQTYTNAPSCTITREGSTTVPTFTISATAITMSVNASAATYNVMCWGTPTSTMMSNPRVVFGTEDEMHGLWKIEPTSWTELVLFLLVIERLVSFTSRQRRRRTHPLGGL